MKNSTLHIKTGLIFCSLSKLSHDRRIWSGWDWQKNRLGNPTHTIPLIPRSVPKNVSRQSHSLQEESRRGRKAFTYLYFQKCRSVVGQWHAIFVLLLPPYHRPASLGYGVVQAGEERTREEEKLNACVQWIVHSHRLCPPPPPLITVGLQQPSQHLKAYVCFQDTFPVCV